MRDNIDNQRTAQINSSEIPEHSMDTSSNLLCFYYEWNRGLCHLRWYQSRDCLWWVLLLQILKRVLTFIGMYAHVDLVRNPIRLWRLPNTLSGDAAVTLFVQSIITWIITMITVNGDLRNGKVQPIGFVPEPKNKLARWYFFLDAEQPVGRRTFLQWLVFVLSQIGRALLFSVPLFLVVWPTTVGILTSSTLGAHRGNDYYYAQTWTPQIFKLLYGGILGLLANPFFVMMWLLTIGWRERRAQSTLPTSSVPGNNSAITVPPPAADAHSANPGDLLAMGQQLPSPRSPGLTTATTTQDDSLVEPPIVSDTLPVRSHARL